VLGAHPDDAEFHAGGLMSMSAALGHVVKMVSVTNGGAGHHTLEPEKLIELRKAEAARAGKIIGAEYVVWPFPDGSLEPTLAVREAIIREIRTFKPDLVLTHRLNDYHPDHRAVGQAVQDASYMVTVPLVVRDTPAILRDPIVAYLPDRFTKPYPLSGDVVIDVGDRVDQIVQMLACHESQVFQWLPYNEGVLDSMPTDTAARVEWLRDWFTSLLRPAADRYREQLIATYGTERGSQIEFAEVYEIGEYARELTAADRARLFPFLPL